MTTVINNPGDNGDGMGIGFMIGILIVIVAGVLFFVYGLPAIRANKAQPNTTNITVQTPAPLAPTE